MTDFGSVIYKIKPGLKSYMFVSEYANVIDELFLRSMSSDYVNRLRHPFTKNDLELSFGFGESSQAILICTDDLTGAEWDLIDLLLSKPKMKNLSVYLYGLPSSYGESVRSRVSKQGMYIEATDPSTVITQKHLSEWFGEECQIHVVDAHKVCKSLNWNLGQIMWTMRSYKVISSGRVLSRPDAQKVLMFCSCKNPVDVVVDLLINKKSLDALSFVSHFTEEQTRELIFKLQNFCTGISALSDLVKLELSDKQMSGQSGLSMVDVIEMRPYVRRYPYSTLAKCNKLLKFAQDHIEEPKLSETVALLWAT